MLAETSSAPAWVEEVSVCACLNLRKAGRAVTQLFDDVMAPSGLKGTQFSVLATAAGLGPTPLSKLAEALVMDRTTLSRNLKPLVDHGLLRVERGQDRRERRVQITEAGRLALEHALPYWRMAQERVTGTFGRERWQTMLGELRGVIAAIETAQSRTS